MADSMNLDKWRLFADLSSDEQRIMLGACEERMLVSGEDLFVENDAGQDSLLEIHRELLRWLVAHRRE